MVRYVNDWLGRWMDFERMDGLMDGRLVEQINGWAAARIYDGWTDKWMRRWMGSCLCKWLVGQVDRLVEGPVDGPVDEVVNRLVDGPMDEQIRGSECPDRGMDGWIGFLK